MYKSQNVRCYYETKKSVDHLKQTDSALRKRKDYFGNTANFLKQAVILFS